MLAQALAVILVLTMGTALMACQGSPDVAPPLPPATPAPEPTPTSAAAITSTPTSTLLTATPWSADPTATPTPPAPAPAATTPPPPTVPPPSATPTPRFPSLSDVPVTEGAIRTTIMASRDHFPSQMRIDSVESGGYNTVPPTSGRHWGAWSDCGFYNYPLPDELLVHNLEHGNIIVSYNLNDDAQVSALRDAIDAIPLAAEYAIVRRYNDIPEGMVAITTWGVLDRMMGVDPQRIARFFRDFPGNTGPEFPNGLPCTTGVQMTDSSGG